MATETIDSLVVTLGLDGKKFIDGHKKARSEFEKTKKAALEFVAAIGGAKFLEGVITGVTETSAALGLMAHNLQVSTQELNAWGNVTRMFGGSAQGLQGTISGLVMEFEKLRLTGESSLIPILNKFRGLDQTDPFKFLTGLKEQLDALNDPTQSKFMLDLLHIDTGTQNLILNTTAEKFHRLMIEQQKLNLVSKDGAAKSQALNEKYQHFLQTLEGMGREFVYTITPMLERGFEKITIAAQYLASHKDVVLAFFTAIGLAAAATMLPFVMAVAPVVLLGAALSMLYEDLETWRKGGTHIIDWDTWKEELEGSALQIANLGFKIKDLWEQFTSSKIANFELFGISLTKVADAIERIISALASIGGGLFEKFTDGLEVIGDAIGIHKNTPESIAADKKKLYENIEAMSDETKVRQKSLHNFLIGTGMSSKMASGVVANITAENSKLNPEQAQILKGGKVGKGYGLMQWEDARQADYARVFGHSMKSVKGDKAWKEQLQFIDWERNNTEKDAWSNVEKRSSTPAEFGRNFALLVERMKDKVVEPEKRGQMAQAYHSVYASNMPLNASIMKDYEGLGQNNLKAANEIHIQNVTVNTPTNDPHRMVNDMSREIANNADFGMS